MPRRKRRMTYILTGNDYSETRKDKSWRNYAKCYSLKSALRKARKIGVGCEVEIWFCGKFKGVRVYC